MSGHWKLSDHWLVVFALLLCLVTQKLSFCWSLNDEGLALLRFRQRVASDPFGALWNWVDDDGVTNPCSWNGVECLDGNVVALDLKDLGLSGTLAPDLGHLFHLRVIILRNNSFSGDIPDEIARLNTLEILDLGYNNFSQPPPLDLCDNLSLTILLLDNNDLCGRSSSGTHGLQMVPEMQAKDSHLPGAQLMSTYKRKLISWITAPFGDASRRKLPEVSPFSLLTGFRKQLEPVFPFLLPPPEDGAEKNAPSNSPSPSPNPFLSPSPSPNPFLSPSPTPSVTAKHHLAPSPTASASQSSLPSPAERHSLVEGSRPNHHRVLMFSAAIGGPILLLVLVAGVIFCQSNKMAVVKPWATGLSGQLQKAFVTGVPKLKRSELDAACEDFSNVIGSSSVYTLYKGTLSSGVEIAVLSHAVASAKDWSKDMKSQFRKKIETLSKVNHKNFVNMLGYCEEEVPFTRMMVFEYAPNGTLFEHLHIREAEHLDWRMRMRIIMGMAYCLQHMHSLSPSLSHRNLSSYTVYLTEDYAAKISDFGFWNDAAAAEKDSSPESNVYSFGVILLEMMTGRFPYSTNTWSLDNWASDYLRGGQSLREMVDPTLNSFEEEQLERTGEVIKMCVHHEPKQRPTMREVTSILREITGLGPDKTIPKLSPLWWAELEIISTEAC